MAEDGGFGAPAPFPAEESPRFVPQAATFYDRSMVLVPFVTARGPALRWRRLILAAAIAAAVCGCRGESPARYLDVATTTSVQNSGLLDVLLPAFRVSSGLIVRVHAAGSGRALEMLKDGIVDAAISHAPNTERSYLAEQPAWVRQAIAWNAFVIVGPREDPSQVRTAPTAADAFRRIAATPAVFVSRGDQSGTHERELELWHAAGARPPPDRLIISGRGMSQALRHADQLRAYTLSDDATFRQLEHAIELRLLFEGDPVLRNEYAVIHQRGNVAAQAFAEWLTTGRGRELIGAYRAGGRAVFLVPAQD
jgi:tungstate transport system substrate-binding protein